MSVEHQTWPLKGTFSISRGSKTVSEVVMAQVSDGEHTGRAECVPYARYGESIESVIAQLNGCAGALGFDADPRVSQHLLPAGAARNALDCALWDLYAKQQGSSVWCLAGLAEPQTVTTVYTLSLDTPENMGAAAKAQTARPLMKLKLAGEGDLERVAAVRENAPDSRLIVDANEGWQPSQVESFAAALADLGVSMVEQPLHSDADAVLADIAHPLPFCADESCHTREGLEQLVGRYDLVNVKLDKTGGLTEALALCERARELGFGVMVGCMMGTSLGMAPGVLIAQGAEYVDLDGPLWMAKDRVPPLAYAGSVVSPANPDLWG
ncbi:MAG: dipeptide epimerase [Chromatiales bacterium]|nr:dipeptide epimerase [Chromatiales bacterium]